MILINRSKKPANLMFNDSRKYDFILRDAGGRKLAQWSDDQPVNPDARLREYQSRVSELNLSETFRRAIWWRDVPTRSRRYVSRL